MHVRRDGCQALPFPSHLFFLDLLLGSFAVVRVNVRPPSVPPAEHPRSKPKPPGLADPRPAARCTSEPVEMQSDSQTPFCEFRRVRGEGRFFLCLAVLKKKCLSRILDRLPKCISAWLHPPFY